MKTPNSGRKLNGRERTNRDYQARDVEPTDYRTSKAFKSACETVKAWFAKEHRINAEISLGRAAKAFREDRYIDSRFIEILEALRASGAISFVQRGTITQITKGGAGIVANAPNPLTWRRWQL
jgi:hypothetical protein